MPLKTTSIPAGLTMTHVRLYAEKVLGWTKAERQIHPVMDLYVAAQDDHGQPIEVCMPHHEDHPIVAEYFHIAVGLMATLQGVTEDEILVLLRNAPFQAWEAGGITDDEALALLDPQLAHYEAVVDEATRRRAELRQQATVIAHFKLNRPASNADEASSSD